MNKSCRFQVGTRNRARSGRAWHFLRGEVVHPEANPETACRLAYQRAGPRDETERPRRRRRRRQRRNGANESPSKSSSKMPAISSQGLMRRTTTHGVRFRPIIVIPPYRKVRLSTHWCVKQKLMGGRIWENWPCGPIFPNCYPSYFRWRGTHRAWSEKAAGRPWGQREPNSG